MMGGMESASKIAKVSIGTSLEAMEEIIQMTTQSARRIGVANGISATARELRIVLRLDLVPAMPYLIVNETHYSCSPFTRHMKCIPEMASEVSRAVLPCRCGWTRIGVPADKITIMMTSISGCGDVSKDWDKLRGRWN